MEIYSRDEASERAGSDAITSSTSYSSIQKSALIRSAEVYVQDQSWCAQSGAASLLRTRMWSPA